MTNSTIFRVVCDQGSGDGDFVFIVSPASYPLAPKLTVQGFGFNNGTITFPSWEVDDTDHRAALDAAIEVIRRHWVGMSDETKQENSYLGRIISSAEIKMDSAINNLPMLAWGYMETMPAHNIFVKHGHGDLFDDYSPRPGFAAVSMSKELKQELVEAMCNSRHLAQPIKDELLKEVA